MSSCCVSDDSADPQPCPQCGTTGPVVGYRTVQPHQAASDEGDWQHCATAECPVVFYLEANTVGVAGLRTQVGHKALDKPTPVCFCFSHTRSDLAADLQANNGVSTIKAAVKTAVAEGFCACEYLNPSGQCCLSDIHRTLKAITIESSTSASTP